MKKLNRLYESILRETEDIDGKTLMVVDIQPEYESGFGHWTHEFVDFMNENYERFNRVIFYYNGADTVGTMDEHEYRNWWYDHEMSEEVLEGSNFYDKGYAFFRNCIDEGIEDEEIVNLVRFMMKNDINDSRELTEEFWEAFMKEGNLEYSDIKDLLEFSDDCINIPDLMDHLRNFSNVVLCGGGHNECLKEVNIALDALNMPYETIAKFVY